MIFKMVSDCELEADSIDDAFKKLSEYFADCSNRDFLIIGGKLEIYKLLNDQGKPMKKSQLND